MCIAGRNDKKGTRAFETSPVNSASYCMNMLCIYQLAYMQLNLNHNFIECEMLIQMPTALLINNQKYG